MNNMRDKIQIFEVDIDTLTREDALKRVGEFLKGNGEHYVVTPNPEIVLAAQKDENFRNILNNASLAMPDGFGLLCAAWFLGLPRLHRMTGVDLMLEICRIASAQGKSVFLLGARRGVGEKAAKVLQAKFPELKIAGVEWGGEIQLLEVKPPKIGHSEAQPKNLPRMRVRPCERDPSPPLAAQDDIVKRINAAAPDVLFVALGHPKQEKWIAAHLKQLPSVKVAMGVGGAFDYIAGITPRAPAWMRSIGLEWLYRMFYEPWRIRRILNAVILFPWMVIRKKIWSASA